MSFYSGLAARCETDKPAALELKLEFDRETDGRWIADIPALPAVEALGLRVVADGLELGEAVPAK